MTEVKISTSRIALSNSSLQRHGIYKKGRGTQKNENDHAKTPQATN